MVFAFPEIALLMINGKQVTLKIGWADIKKAIWNLIQTAFNRQS